MDAREIKLDCSSLSDGSYAVYDENGGGTIAQGGDPEHAWANAADALAKCLSEIRRSACNLSE